MNKTALMIPRPGMSSKIIQQGYADALRHLGWKVYCCNPKTKLGCRKLIEDYGVRLIMTHSRFGIRQLPTQVINDNQVAVIVDILPLNPANATIDGPYEFAHDDEPDLINEIQTAAVHTRIEPNLWSEYMCGWHHKNINKIMHLPMAGNMVKALSPTCSILTDVAMVANFSHRQGTMRHLIEPLFKRLDLLDYSYQAFGDNIWQLASLNYNGPLMGDITKLAHVYATAKVSLNIHTEQQIKLQALVNERSFQILLCGGLMVTDNPLTSKYLGDHCLVATSITDYIKKVIEVIENQGGRFDKIRASIEYVANRHTYFNRLADLFWEMGLLGFVDETKTKGQRAAVQHCWELDARLSAEERGIPYEQKLIGTT